jgi:GMP synthase (glutamine-hydrolysing)
MRALAIVYERDAGPGVFAEAARSTGAELDIWLRREGPEPPLEPREYDAALCFGGSMNVDEDDRHPWLGDDRRLLAEMVDRGTPVLAVCLGAQILTQALGGEVGRLPDPEIGWYEIEVSKGGAEDPLLAPLAPGFRGFEWHSYGVSLPPGAVELARTSDCLQSYRLGEAAWAIQFHAEVTRTDAESWMDDYRSDADAVRIGLDIESLRRETRERIGAWNRLGRELCGRFFDAAAIRG